MDHLGPFRQNRGLGRIMVTLALGLFQNHSLAIPTVGLEQGAMAAMTYDLERRGRLGQLEVAEAKRRAALRNLWPTLSLSYQRQASRLPGEVENPDRLVRLDSSQVLWDGGQTALAARLEELSISIERESISLRETDIRSQHRSLYFEALRRKQDLTNLEEVARLAFDQARIAREEYRLGQITESDLLELEGRGKEAEKNRLSGLVAWRRALREWRLLIGAPSESPVEVRGQLTAEYFFLPPPSNFAGLAETALKRRIENRRQELERQKAAGEDQLEKMAVIPTLRVTVYGQISGFDRRQISGDGGVSISMKSSILGNVLEGSYGLEAKRNLGGLGENQGLRFGLLEEPMAAVARVERDQAARLKNEAVQRERARLGAQIREEGEAVHLGFREMEILAEEEALWQKRLSVMGLRVELGEARRTDWMEQWVKYQEKRSARSAASAQWVARLSAFETLCGLGVGGFGLIRESHPSGPGGMP